MEATKKLEGFALLASYFTTENARGVVTLTDDRPDELRDAVYELHDGMMPSDWLYEACHDMVDALSEYDDPDEDSVWEAADGCVSVYDHERASWLTEYAGATEAVDNWREEVGDDGNSTIMELLGAAMCDVYQRIGRAMLEVVRELEEVNRAR